MSRFVLSQRAHCDLEEIEEYWGRRNPSAALAVMERVQETFDLLARHRQLGRSRDELLPGLRSFPVGNYIIYYRLASEGIKVHRVLHGARDHASAFDPLEE